MVVNPGALGGILKAKMTEKDLGVTKKNFSMKLALVLPSKEQPPSSELMHLKANTLKILLHLHGQNKNI